MSGLATQARRDGIAPKVFSVIIPHINIPVSEGKLLPQVTLRITPVLSEEDTEYPSVIYMEILREGIPLASGTATAKWVDDFPEVIRVEYRGNQSCGIGDDVLGHVANEVGLYLERPDEL